MVTWFELSSGELVPRSAREMRKVRPTVAVITGLALLSLFLVYKVTTGPVQGHQGPVSLPATKPSAAHRGMSAHVALPVGARALAKLASDSVFLSAGQIAAIPQPFESQSLFILTVHEQDHLQRVGTSGVQTHLTSDACLSVESVIARRINVEVTDVGKLEQLVDKIAQMTPNRPVVVSLGNADMYFTAEGLDENFASQVQAGGDEWVTVPGSRICTGPEHVCRGYGQTAESEFKYASDSAVLGRAKTVSKFIKTFMATCGGANALAQAETREICMHRMFLEQKFPIRIDYGTQLFLETHDFKAGERSAVAELPKDAAWGVSEEGVVRNPKTNVAVMALIFDHHVGHYAGKWRVRNFVFQPQAEIGFLGERKSFLQEVCPFSSLRWLPLPVPPKKKPLRPEDGRCSPVCMASDGVCGGETNQFPTAEGYASECAGLYGCCSPSGWCGYSKEHCDCPLCIDYRRVNALRDQLFGTGSSPVVF